MDDARTTSISFQTLTRTSHATVRQDDAGVTTLEITGAGSMNLLDSTVIADLTAVLHELRLDQRCRVLVLRGSGEKAFVGGADIKEMATLAPGSAAQFITRLKGLCGALRDFPVPVIARISGWCLGGGLEVALSCDIRLCGDDARFAMPEVAVGIPSVIQAALLPRLVGDSRARWMILTGEAIDAQTAAAWGLVHEVTQAAELDRLAMQRAARLATYGAGVVRAQKRLLNDWQRLPLDEAIDRSVNDFADAYRTDEPRIYMTRFIDRKRVGSTKAA